MFPESGVRIFDAENDLIAQLSSELDCFSAEELRELLIVLPTQRLAPYLLATLAAKHGSFVAPTVLTLETLIHQHANDALKSNTILSPSAEELLIASLLKQGNFRHLQKGHEHEIREFFSQIDSFHLKDNAFSRLRSLIRKDIYRDEWHIGSLVERVDELHVLYKRYQDLLKSKNAMSSDQFAVQCVQDILNDWKDLKTLKWRWTFLACFTTVKPYCKDLFRLLAKKENLSLLFTEAPKVLGHHSPLKELLEYILEKEIPVAHHEDLPLIKENTRIVACDSIFAEVQEALACIRKYLDQGCPESRIGLLVSHEKTYAKILASALEKEKFKSNLAIAQPFSQTLLGSWLLRLFKYLLASRSHAQDRKTQQNIKNLLSDFLSHPLTSKSLAPERTVESIQILQYELASSDAENAWEADPFVKNIFYMLFPLQTLLKEQKKEKLLIWNSALREVIANFRLPEQKRSEEEAMHQFEDFCEQWSHCWDASVSGSEFLHALVNRVQSLETRSVGFPLEGVQVVDLIEARYVPFEVIVVLGCVEGRFPRSLPNDRLVGDLLKVRLGISGWQYIEALEDTTFHLLCNQAKYFSFLYSLNKDFGSRSRFLERIVGQDRGLALAHNESSLLLRCPGTHIVPSGQLPGHDGAPKGRFTADRYALFEHISASSLAQVFRCPYQFLLNKLDVKAKEEDSSSLWEGRWLHEILEAFYTGELRGHRHFESLPQKLILKKSQIVPYAEQRLHILTEHCLPNSVKGSPFHWHLLHFAWPRFAQHWSKFFEEETEDSWVFSTKQSLKEYSLVGKGLPLDRKTDRWSSLLGTLDSLDSYSEHTVLVDYKRKHVDAVSEVVSGLSPQLPLYALAMAQNRFYEDESFLDRCLVGYWSIIEGRWQARGVGEHSKTWALEKKLVSAQTPLLHNIVDTLQTLWDQTVFTLLQEQKDFAPQANEACDYCPFSGICRIEEQVS